METAEFFEDAFKYRVGEKFTINFDDGSEAKCIAMKPPEHPVCGAMGYKTMTMSTTTLPINPKDYQAILHMPPEIFISDGTPDSIVGRWVAERGNIGGVHHMAYEVDDVQRTMIEWENKGWAKFQTKTPLTCPGLIQVFTTPHPLTGIIYELINRKEDNAGFCKDNVKQLMINSDIK